MLNKEIPWIAWSPRVKHAVCKVIRPAADAIQKDKESMLVSGLLRF
jgi:hypothetical protein